jgi:hypothetical protein
VYGPKSLKSTTLNDIKTEKDTIIGNMLNILKSAKADGNLIAVRKRINDTSD